MRDSIDMYIFNQPNCLFAVLFDKLFFNETLMGSMMDLICVCGWVRVRVRACGLKIRF